MHKQNDELTRQRDECIRQMQNVEREKKHESALVIFCIKLPWIYGKLPKIQKITKKCPVPPFRNVLGRQVGEECPN